MATILIIGLGSDYLSSQLNINIGIRLNETVSISGLSFAALVGIVMNLVLNILQKTSKN